MFNERHYVMDSTAGPLWHQISQTLAEEINGGEPGPGERLPASADLAARFGVNRNTILRAVSHLRQEGLVRTERGGRMYVEKFIPYRVGEHDRLEQNMRTVNLEGRRQLVSVEELKADKEVAHKLGCAIGTKVARAVITGFANDIPISHTRVFVVAKYAAAYVQAMRRIAEASGEGLRTSDVLASIGVKGLHRISTHVRGRPARPEEQLHLRMPPAESIIELDVVSVDGTNLPVSFSIVAFASSRVEFVLDETMSATRRLTDGGVS